MVAATVFLSSRSARARSFSSSRCLARARSISADPFTPKLTVITAEFRLQNNPLDVKPLLPRLRPHTSSDSKVIFSIFFALARSTEARLIFARVNAECRALAQLYDRFNRSRYSGSCICFSVVARIFSIVFLLCRPPLFQGTLPAFASPIFRRRNCSTLVMSLKLPTDFNVSNSVSLITTTSTGRSFASTPLRTRHLNTLHVGHGHPRE
mmetsp:Transcript_8405/g.31249  ORF Transcript_8405/g.31249 Transcript_8405/m.31249 type:complete len:209 (-) Transcript_8405:572-1198(-)